MGFLFQPMQNGNPFGMQLFQTLAPYLQTGLAQQQPQVQQPQLPPGALERANALNGFESQVRGISAQPGTADWMGQWEALRPQWTSIGYAPYQIEGMMRNQLLGGDVFTGQGAPTGGTGSQSALVPQLGAFVSGGVNPFAQPQQLTTMPTNPGISGGGLQMQAPATFVGQPPPEQRALQAFQPPKLTPQVKNPFAL